MRVTNPLKSLAACLSVLSLVAAWSPSDAASGPGKQHQGGALSASKFVTLYPFVVPIVSESAPSKQYTIVLAIELVEEGTRDEIIRLEPRIRNALYPELFRLISFRDREPRYISSAALKRKLTPVVQQVAGLELVKGIIIQEAYESDLP